MNYLEIINKCLSELNYRQVEEFSELEKPEHLRIMNHINMISMEICSSDNWNFLLRREILTLEEGTTELENTINGQILAIYIDDKEYKYCEDFQRFMTDDKLKRFFSIFNYKILLPEFNEEKLINIIYYTRNTAVTTDGEEKIKLEDAEDISLIPENFIEPILVYGTCLRMKGDTQHYKYNYWQSMYNSSVAMMRSDIAVDADYAPYVRIIR